jgi:hypothetical protein
MADPAPMRRQVNVHIDEQNGADLIAGRLAGSVAATLSPETARQALDSNLDAFRIGAVTPAYWQGYQEGAGFAQAKPGYPGASHMERKIKKGG